MNFIIKLITLLIFFILIPIFLMLCVVNLSILKKNPFFIQDRVGQHGRIFKLYKFKTMKDSLTGKVLGIASCSQDRITPLGRILRKTKLDELPQILNILKGDMNWVGPRPELKKYVDLYPESDKKIILSIKPGVTDPTSIWLSDEEEKLNQHDDPESFYIQSLLSEKIASQISYVKNCHLMLDFKIIVKTALILIKNIFHG